MLVAVNKYAEYFESSETSWLRVLEEIKTYIDKNHKRPPRNSKTKSIKQLGQWIGTQKTNYTKSVNIMRNPEIRKAWETFIGEYFD